MRADVNGEDYVTRILWNSRVGVKRRISIRSGAQVQTHTQMYSSSLFKIKLRVSWGFRFGQMARAYGMDGIIRDAPSSRYSTTLTTSKPAVPPPHYYGTQSKYYKDIKELFVRVLR